MSIKHFTILSILATMLTMLAVGPPARASLIGAEVTLTSSVGGLTFTGGTTVTINGSSTPEYVASIGGVTKWELDFNAEGFDIFVRDTFNSNDLFTISGLNWGSGSGGQITAVTQFLASGPSEPFTFPLGNNFITVTAIDTLTFDFRNLPFERTQFGQWQITASHPPTPTPEPATLTIFGLGLAGLGLMRRRNRIAS